MVKGKLIPLNGLLVGDGEKTTSDKTFHEWSSGTGIRGRHAMRNLATLEWLKSGLTRSTEITSLIKIFSALLNKERNTLKWSK